MTEHEKLKVICDKIGYKHKKYTHGYGYVRIIGEASTFDESMPNNDIIELDVREIIFTPEFMEKFVAEYCIQKNYCQTQKYLQSDIIDIFNHLDDPVNYLYNLILE